MVSYDPESPLFFLIDSLMGGGLGGVVGESECLIGLIWCPPCACAFLWAFLKIMLRDLLLRVHASEYALQACSLRINWDGDRLNNC